MEAWHRLSTLGSAGALGIWRGSLPILSARLLDPGRRARCGPALESGAGRVLLDRAHACRSVHVPAGAAVAPGSGRAVCRCVLCAESLPLANRLLAERLRRTLGCGPASAIAALSSAALFAGIRAWLSPDTMAEFYAGRGLANERTCGGDDPLLSRRTDVDPCCDSGCDWRRARRRRAAILESTELATPSSDLGPYSAGDAPRSRPRLVLSASRYLRTEVDRCQPGAVTGSTAAGQFPFQDHCRSRSQSLQSSRLNRSASRNRRPHVRDLVFKEEARRDSRPRLSGRAQRDRRLCRSSLLDASHRLGCQQCSPDAFSEQLALAAFAEAPVHANSLPLAVVHERRLSHASPHGGQALDHALAGVCRSVGCGYPRGLPLSSSLVGHVRRYSRDERCRCRRHR